MKTQQMNIRVTEDLAEDLDIVSNILKINKTEWIRTKLAEETQREKNRLLMELSTLYAKGMISKKNIQKLAGKEIAELMESTKNTAERSVKAGKKYGRELKGKLHH